jgi:ubiquinol-cytochrome c reductase cytochrome b subunit
LIKAYLGQVWRLATPKNISYHWGFGRFLGLVMVLQVASGLFLAFYYVRGTQAWDSVVELTRDVRNGWLLRLIHSNTASFVFVILFIHIFRGIFYGSFYLIFPWVRGWIIILFTIIAAFLGYVLPWGQMSFWGATVIINLLRVLPMGKLLVVWLWGGFYVSSFTCSFFYAIHFIVPFLVLAIAGLHLILLHITGRSVPGGVSFSAALKLKFSHFFSFKDIANISLIWLIILLLLANPDIFADPVNFVSSDLSSSPLHIQPEWYFLHLYAVLRSIPNKLGGLIGFVLALVILLFLALTRSVQRISQYSFYWWIFWSFLSCNILLIWLGIQAVEDPFILMGQTLTAIYFMLIFRILLFDQVLVLLWRIK